MQSQPQLFVEGPYGPERAARWPRRVEGPRTYEQQCLVDAVLWELCERMGCGCGCD